MKSSPRPGSRDLIELSVGYALILIAVWTPLHVQRIIFWVAFSWIISTTLLARNDRNDLGLSLSGWHRSLWVVGIALVLASADLLISFWYSTLHPLYGPVSVGRHMWGYVIWAFMQQFVLQDFFFLRLLRVVPSRGAAILTAAALFSVAHLPNPLLTIITLAWGIAACAIFLRYRNLYVLGIAHGILGLCIAVSVPNAIHHHMRVGLGYLRYDVEQRANRARLGAGPSHAESDLVRSSHLPAH